MSYSADPAERARAEAGSRNIKRRRIPQVEPLEAKREPDLFANPRVFGRRHVEVDETRPPDIRQCASDITEAEGRRIDKLRCIEVLVEPLADGTFQLRRPARAVEDAGRLQMNSCC